MTYKKTTWLSIFFEFGWKIGAVIVIGMVAFIWGSQQIQWLTKCAEDTHGSIEREYDGETVYTDADGRHSSSNVKYHLYVRTKSGKRIEYGQKYEAE